MKLLSCCATVLFLVYLPSSKALPEVGVEPHHHHHEQDNPLFQTSGVERRDIRLLPLQPDTIELSLFKTIENHRRMSGWDNEVSINKILNWLYNYFLTGKYRDYRASLSIVQAPLEKPDDRKPVKRKMPGNNPEFRNQKKIVDKQKRKPKAESGQKYTLSELVTRAQNFGITYEVMVADLMPSGFPSQWLWNVICAIDVAVKKYQNTRLHFSSFEEVLDNHDAGLRIVAKPILQLVFSNEHNQLVKPRIRNMVSFWLDQIVFFNPHLDWRSWLLSYSGEPDSNDLYVTNLKPQHNEASAPYNFAEAELNSIERPQKYFSSIILWDVSVEIDNSIDKRSPLTWNDDLILREALPRMLYLFARADSMLSASENYLMGYWLDRAFRRISTQDTIIRSGEELHWREPAPRIPVDVNLLYLTKKIPEPAPAFCRRAAAVRAQKEIFRIQKSTFDD